mmetsp:Transcript_37021/g.42536  ORF Transcript_37021/g.42536 Transcript_37021/m.42536 type:complete len:310 (+) Transcript_37021:200-1129(+)
MYMLHKQEKTSVLKAFNHLNNAVRNYSKFYQSQVLAGSWSVELIDFLCGTLKDLAYLAEKAYKSNKEEVKEVTDSPIKITKVTLEQVFNKSQIIKESFPNSRKLAAFYVIIHICQMYFQANKFRICERFIHWVEKMQDGFELLPEHVKVSYYYYEGLLCLFQHNYMRALKCLSYSVDNCKKEKSEFQSRVMRYLVPLNILMGDFPEDKLLEAHKLHEYKELSKACKAGNLQKFEQEIGKHEEIFLKCGIYLVLEKLKNVAFRNLIMRVYEANEGKHILKLDFITEEFNKDREDSKGEEEDEEFTVPAVE